MNGLFITFEGIEGCGKSTQMARLGQSIQARGYAVETTREPGGTAIGEAIREILLDPANRAMAAETELLLYQAARAQHVRERIHPAIAAGSIVLCDRFCDSTLAYQGAGRALSESDTDFLHHTGSGGLVPDLTVLIDVPVEVGLARVREGGEPDRIEEESRAFHERVRQGYLALAQAEPKRIRLVQGDRPPEAVEKDIDAIVAPLLEGRRT